MESLLLYGGKIVSKTEIIEKGYLLVEDKGIASVGPIKDLPLNGFQGHVIKLKEGSLVLPGFIDVHLHGLAGVDVMDGTPEAIRDIIKTLPVEGTTSFLATTMTAEIDTLAEVIKNASTCMVREYQGAELLGINLEGPFINCNQAGAQAKDKTLLPDIKTFQRLEALASGKIRMVTIAPELEGSQEFIRYLKQQGIIPAVGHSEAEFSSLKEAVAGGLSHATHLYNAMRGFHHREPGVVGGVLLQEAITAELILDGLHVSDEAAQLAYNLKGSHRIQLITDSMRAKNMKEGTYELGGQHIVVKKDEARLPNGRLAGSLLSMNKAIKRAFNLVGRDLQALVRISSTNAAEELGIANRKGSIEVGKDADVVILNPDFEVERTICRGKVAYSST